MVKIFMACLKSELNILTCIYVFVEIPEEMVITWVTINKTVDSIVEYGRDNMNSATNGTEDMFTDDGTEKRTLFMHRVTLTGLIPGQGYGMFVSFTKSCYK